MAPSLDENPFGGSSATGLYKSSSLSDAGARLTVEFLDTSFTYHTQWLFDARCDDTPARTFHTTFTQNEPMITATSIAYTPTKTQGELLVSWSNNTASIFPVPWLRVMAPLVAQSKIVPETHNVHETDYTNGWTVDTLKIPEVSYQDLFEPSSESVFELTLLKVLDLLLQERSPGIIKIIGLPPADLEDERNKSNTLVTRVLKQIFDGVFQHSRRGTDKTFNVASHHEGDAQRAAVLPNYDTNQILLPHVDHAHYTHPIQVQGWYGLEGKSENTFASSIAALETMRKEAPELVPYLYNTPMAVGRVVHYYDPPLIQGTLDTAVTVEPGFAPKVKRIRWHPHLTGSLLAPYEIFDRARAAYVKYQEIIRRDSHLLKVALLPGDLYIWNNFRIVHGRERVLEVPRTGVGQTVPEQTVQEKYRSLLFKRLSKSFAEKWLVHMPVPQLRDMVAIVESL